MKKMTMIVSLTLMVLGYGENLLINGDFNSGSKGWKFKNKQGQGAGQGFVSNGAALISLGAEDGEQKIYQDIPVKPGQVYQLKASVKTEGKAALYVYFYLSVEEGKWLPTAVQGPMVKSADWKEVSYALNVKDANRIRVDFRVKDPGMTAQIKNVSFGETVAEKVSAE